MYLYEIPRGSKIKVDQGIITFHHLDGMFSYCTCDWKEGPVHLYASERLEKRGRYYHIVQDVNDK